MQTVRILWFAMMMSQAALFAVAFLLSSGGNGSPDLSLVGVLAIAALSLGAASFAMPRIVRRGTDQRLSALMQDASLDREQLRRAVISGLTTPFLMSCALSEAVGVVGVALAVLGAGVGVFAPFLLAGFLLVGVRFPSEERFFGPFADAVREVQ